jgi:hypothetical protein
MNACAVTLGLMLAGWLAAAPAVADTADASMERLNFWANGGLAEDYTHGPENDPLGFWAKDFRNNPTGIAADCGIERELPLPKWLGYIFESLWLLGNPFRPRLGVGVEYYPLAAPSRLASDGGVATRQFGAGNKLVLTAASGFARVFRDSEARIRPFVEFGAGYAFARGDPYEDRDPVTNALIARVSRNQSSGLFGEFGGGLRFRRGASRELTITLRTQGYTDFISGGNSAQLVVGTLIHGPSRR